MRAIKLCLIVCALVALSAVASAQTVDIYTALQQGTVRAEFYGNGDSSVRAILHRLPGGPTAVVFPAGATFRVAQLGGRGGFAQYGGYGGGYGQYGGYGGGYGGSYEGSSGGRRREYGGFGGRGGGRLGQGGGGRQGMFGYRSTTARLDLASTVTLTLPTLCMDYNKPAPTPRDAMVLLPPPSPLMERFAKVLDAEHPSQPAAQLATWALTDNPSAPAAQVYLLDIIPGMGKALAQQREEILARAAELIEALGLRPANFRMFGPAPIPAG